MIHRASVPGERPAMDTGVLVRSMKAKRFAATQSEVTTASSYPTLREWWGDVEHRRITFYMALIAAISIAVYVFGVWNR